MKEGDEEDEVKEVKGKGKVPRRLRKRWKTRRTNLLSRRRSLQHPRIELLMIVMKTEESSPVLCNI